MLAPDEKLKLSTKPYLSATARFASGADTPRDFLERCLADIAALEPKIGAFVHLNLDGARAAADQSTARWREGQPRSPIDGMPIGIKDIIETIDMPTEQGSPLFVGCRTERDAASVAALREAGAVIVGKTVTTEFAATEPRGTRNPHDLRRTPGGSSSGSAAGGRRRHAQRGARHAGDRLDHSPGELLRLHRLQGHGRRAQSRRQLRRLEPKRDRRAGGDVGGRLAGRLRDRGARRRRSRLSRPVRTGERAGAAKSRAASPSSRPPAGRDASADAKQAMADALARLKAAGIDVLHAPIRCAKLAAVEAAIAPARPLSMRINGWESRWPLNTYRERDASKVSRVMLARLAEAEAMSLDDYRNDLAQRDKARALYAELAAECDACVSLSAPAAAPLGLESTGDPNCTVHASLLGIPAVSLPVLQDQGLPLGLQVTGFVNGDAADLRGGCFDQGFVLEWASAEFAWRRRRWTSELRRAH